MDQRVDCLVRSGRVETIEAVREYAVRKLSSAVRCFQHHVRHVTVRLVDVNGPRRGVDTRCSIVVELVEGGSLFVEATAAWPFAAITRAAGRVSAGLRRQSSRHALRKRDSSALRRRLDEYVPA